MGSGGSDRGEILWAVISVIALGLCLAVIVGVWVASSALGIDGSARPIELGESVSGVVLRPEGQRYSFEAEAGDYIAISMEGQFEYDTYLELYDPGGDLLMEDDDSGDGHNSRIMLLLPEDGTYTITARGYSNRRGPFTLSVDHAQTQGTLRFDEPVEAAFYSEVGHFWQFEGVAGDAVRIEMTRLDDMDPYLALYTPDAMVYIEDDDSGGDLNAMIEIILPQTGVYIIHAYGYSASTGRYELLITRDDDILQQQRSGA